MFKMLSLVH